MAHLRDEEIQHWTLTKNNSTTKQERQQLIRQIESAVRQNGIKMGTQPVRTHRDAHGTINPDADIGTSESDYDSEDSSDPDIFVTREMESIDDESAGDKTMDNTDRGEAAEHGKNEGERAVEVLAIPTIAENFGLEVAEAAPLKEMKEQFGSIKKEVAELVTQNLDWKFPGVDR